MIFYRKSAVEYARSIFLKIGGFLGFFSIFVLTVLTTLPIRTASQGESFAFRKFLFLY